MRAAVPAVMELAQPLKVLRRLHPRTNLVRVRDARVLVLQQSQVDLVLQRPLDVRVVQLQRLVEGAIREVAAALPNRALIKLWILLRAPMVIAKIDVVRIALASPMLRVMDLVVTRMGLPMSLDDLVRIHHVSPTFLERFWAKVDRSGECWEWRGSRQSQGYGMILGGQRQRILAHRASYILHAGPIGERLDLDHLCRNRACVRPEHLEPVTHRVNVRRGASGDISRSKTHCPQNHAYDETNTYHFDGRRYCKECNRAAQKKENRKRATCHPDRPHRGHGFCNACLLRQRKAERRAKG